MAKTKRQKKIGKVMREFKKGVLKSGSGAKVKSPKQAMAIALSEAESTRNMAAGGAVCRPTGQGYRSSRKPEGMA